MANFIVISTRKTSRQGLCPVCLGCRIQLLLCCGVRLPPLNECPGYYTKQSDGDVPVILELWGILSTPLLPLLPGPPWAEAVAPERALSIGQIELSCVFILNWIAWKTTVFTYKLRTYAELNCLKWNFFCMLNWIVWNWTVFWHWYCLLVLNWIVWNRIVFIFNCVSTKTILMRNWIFWNRSVYMYKIRFGINNLQWLMYHKTKLHQTKSVGAVENTDYISEEG